MDRIEHRAAAPDGTRLHWSEAGRGAPPVLLTDGIGCAGYIWRHLEPALATEHRVIHWNYRGHGKSEPPADPARVLLEDCVQDLLAILDDAGEQRAVIAGHSMGVQVALEAYRRAPERVQGLVLICGAPGRPIDTFHDSGALKLAFPYARAAVERYPALARSIFRAVTSAEVAIEFALAFEVDRERVDRDDLVRYFTELAEIDPVLFVRMLTSAAAHDTSAHLPEVRVPTLVVAGERDSFTPMRLSVRIQQAIPGSELLVLPGGTHVAPLEHPEAVAARVLAFLRDRVPGKAPRRRRARAADAKPRPRAAPGATPRRRSAGPRGAR